MFALKLRQVQLHQPPFRAEHIGSLLRRAALLRERARFALGEIDKAELAACGGAIRSMPAMQPSSKHIRIAGRRSRFPVLVLCISAAAIAR